MAAKEEEWVVTPEEEDEVQHGIHRLLSGCETLYPIAWKMWKSRMDEPLTSLSIERATTGWQVLKLVESIHRELESIHSLTTGEFDPVKDPMDPAVKFNIELQDLSPRGSGALSQAVMWLTRAGIREVGVVRALSDAELLQIEGMNDARLRVLRNAIAYYDSGDAE